MHPKSKFGAQFVWCVRMFPASQKKNGKFTCWVSKGWGWIAEMLAAFKVKSAPYNVQIAECQVDSLAVKYPSVKWIGVRTPLAQGRISP